jgi:hypothetical protein
MTGRAKMSPNRKDEKPVLDFRVEFTRDVAPDRGSNVTFSLEYVSGVKTAKVVEVSGTYDESGDSWLISVPQEQFHGEIALHANWTTGSSSSQPGQQQHMDQWYSLGSKLNHKRMKVVLPKSPKTVAIVLDGTPEDDTDILRHYAATMAARLDVDSVEKVTFSASADTPEWQARNWATSFHRAAELAGVRGTVVLAAGHGVNANRANARQASDRVPVHFRLIAGSVLEIDDDILDTELAEADAKLVKDWTVNGVVTYPPLNGAKEQEIKNAERRQRVRTALTSMRLALRDYDVAELVVAACGVGADPEFVQALADQLRVRVKTTSHWVTASNEIQGAQSRPETDITKRYRLETRAPNLTNPYAAEGLRRVEVGKGLTFAVEVVRDPTTTTP